jgi:hypothetical protein
MYRFLALACLVIFPPSTDVEKRDFPKLLGKWERVAEKNTAGKKIALEFFAKEVSGFKYPFVHIHATWTENGVAREAKLTRSCWFQEHDKQTHFTLSISPASAEPTPCVKYRFDGTKLELHDLPALTPLPHGINLSGTYQRPKGK